MLPRYFYSPCCPAIFYIIIIHRFFPCGERKVSIFFLITWKMAVRCVYVIFFAVKYSATGKKKMTKEEEAGPCITYNIHLGMASYNISTRDSSFSPPFRRYVDWRGAPFEYLFLLPCPLSVQLHSATVRFTDRTCFSF